MTLQAAYEFAGMAADEVMGYLRPALAEAEIGKVAELLRECCAAAIVSAIVLERSAQRTDRRIDRQA